MVMETSKVTSGSDVSWSRLLAGGRNRVNAWEIPLEIRKETALEILKQKGEKKLDKDIIIYFW